MYTTASWYYRVASAAAHGSGTGSLSGRIASLPDEEKRVFRTKLASLPDSIGLVGPRTLVPITAAVHAPRRLSYLAAEALAVAVAVEASILVSTDSPLLRDACKAIRIEYRVVDDT